MLKVNSYIYIKNGDIIYIEVDILVCLYNMLTITSEQKSENIRAALLTNSRKFSKDLEKMQTPKSFHKQKLFLEFLQKIC